MINKKEAEAIAREFKISKPAVKNYELKLSPVREINGAYYFEYQYIWIASRKQEIPNDLLAGAVGFLVSKATGDINELTVPPVI